MDSFENLANIVVPLTHQPASLLGDTLLKSDIFVLSQVEDFVLWKSIFRK